MKRSWMSIYRGLLKLSIREYLRDPLPTVFTLAMPLLFLMIFGLTFKFVGPKSSVESPVYKVGVVYGEGNTRGENIEKNVDDLQAFEAVRVNPGLSMLALQNKDIYMVIDVPNRHADEVTISFAKPMAALAEIAAAQVNNAQISSDVALPKVNFVEQTQPETKTGGYIAFIMPALIAFALVQLCLYGTATPLVAAKEHGLMRHYAVMPMPRSALLAAQVTVRLMMAALQIVMMLLLSFFVLQINISGSLLSLAGICAIGTVMLVSLGYAIGGWFSSLGIATAVIAMLNLYIMAFGQIFVDLSSFAFAKILLFTTPVAFLSDAIRQITTGNAGAFPMLLNVIVMVLWTVAGVFVSLRTFNFSVKER